jgi:hypothetical protein
MKQKQIIFVASVQKKPLEPVPAGVFIDLLMLEPLVGLAIPD